MASDVLRATPAFPRLLRPLPRHVRPFPDETLNSYAQRLERANRLAPGTVKRLSRATGATHLSALSQLAELSPSTLIRAIPDLRSPADLGTYPDLRGRVSTGARQRMPCKLCAARREPAGAIAIWARHQDLICRRHRRWLGATQFSFGAESHVLQAARRHRTAIKMHGQRRVSLMYFDALDVIERWFRWRLELPDAQRLHARLHARHDDKRSADIWAAAYYPTTIGLLHVMLDTQRSRSHRGPPPTVLNLARERVAAEVTSGYVPTGGFDPFLHWINSPVSDDEEAAPSEVLE